jgi:hypothetical protein
MQLQWMTQPFATRGWRGEMACFRPIAVGKSANDPRSEIPSLVFALFSTLAPRIVSFRRLFSLNLFTDPI